MTEVCLIDDDHAVRRTLRNQLESGGFKVVEASNGHEGLRLLEHHDCKIAVIDIIMPEKEGLSTILEIKSRFPQVRILAISGRDPQYLKLATELGAHETLSKPLRTESFLDAVRRLVAPVT
jgi:DNA-binding NarL/FixJ family response regulator